MYSDIPKRTLGLLPALLIILVHDEEMSNANFLFKRPGQNMEISFSSPGFHVIPLEAGTNKEVNYRVSDRPA